MTMMTTTATTRPLTLLQADWPMTDDVGLHRRMRIAHSGSFVKKFTTSQWFRTLEKPDINIPLSHELGSKGVSERANEWAQRSKRVSERCELMSERTSEWPRTNVPISSGSEFKWCISNSVLSAPSKWLTNEVSETKDHETWKETRSDIGTARNAKILLRMECIAHENAEKMRGRLRFLMLWVASRYFPWSLFWKYIKSHFKWNLTKFWVEWYPYQAVLTNCFKSTVVPRQWQ